MEKIFGNDFLYEKEKFKLQILKSSLGYYIAVDVILFPSKQRKLRFRRQLQQLTTALATTPQHLQQIKYVRYRING